jgi:hypothetical protein
MAEGGAAHVGIDTDENLAMLQGEPPHHPLNMCIHSLHNMIMRQLINHLASDEHQLPHNSTAITITTAAITTTAAAS